MNQHSRKQSHQAAKKNNGKGKALGLAKEHGQGIGLANSHGKGLGLSKEHGKGHNNGHAYGKNKSGVPNVIKIGKLLIPTNPIIKDMKASVSYDNSTQTVTITKDSITIKFVGDSAVYVNGQQVDFSTISNSHGRIVPMEFIQNTLNPSTTPQAIDITTSQAINLTTPQSIDVTSSATTAGN